MSDAAPKKWVKALRLKSTPWRVLVGLWGHARYTADGPAFVFPTRNTLAEEIGLTLGTLRNGLDALAALGWVRRERNGWKLAWMSPGAFDRPADGPARPTGGPAHPQAAPAHGRTAPAHPQADPRPTGGPHNFKGTSNSTSNELEVERATPTPSVKPAESGVLDPWPERVKAASVGAHYHMRSGGTGDSSYQGLLTQARHTYGDDDVIKTLLAHEARAPEHAAGRPPATQVFWSKYRPWVERVLDIEAPAKPGQFSMSGALRIVGGPS